MGNMHATGHQNTWQRIIQYRDYVRGMCIYSLQFTVIRIIYQIFGAMTKNSYCEISEYFGIPTVEQLITNRHDRFLNRFRSQGNYVCQALIM